MDKTYDPKQIESKFSFFWESNNIFSSELNSNSDEAYCIMLPPPNVTGSLHMGHAFQQTIMDILTRYHRSKGAQTLWQPGTDHAGIATQMIVERQLAKQNITKHDIGRKKFIEKIWEWKQQSGGTITSQMRRLGASVDWEKECFTMDSKLSIAVRKVFVQLYNEGLIYRGKRLVNWDPVLKTAVSDLEVINAEENGFMCYISYPICDSDETIVVSTTRPETMLGDTAVAVNPNDKRYINLIGKKIKLPITNRIIPIIADDYVDMDFGTGCVKITPAHDFNDYKIGKKHNLKIINIFTEEAKINNSLKSKYIGLDRFDARKKIIEDLKQQGFLVKIEPHKIVIPRGDRTNAIIEPYITNQWFVKVAPLAKPAIDAVKNNKIRFVPENWSKTYFNWMENIEDWCISRQIWWGHEIPAWYDDKGNIFVADSLIEAQKQAGKDVKLTQDSDVLDTWFSSALWPFSTLGWPDKTEQMSRFYPTNVLVTGFDIIFFWVSRMIMFGLKFTNNIPFKDIYITGLIKDGNGQKMSKSKGNIIDPIDLIDGISLNDLLEKRTANMMQPKIASKIKKQTKNEFKNGISPFGADALRFTFAALSSFRRDIKFDLKIVEGYRNFCNKLWNASRFVLIKFKEDNIKLENLNNNVKLSMADKWIISRLQKVKLKTEEHLANYRIDLMSHKLYEFVWHDYCDWYLEFSKSLLNDNTTKKGTQATLLNVLNEILILLHPIIPFITEEIYQQYQNFNSNKYQSLSSQTYLKVDNNLLCKESEDNIKWAQDFILGVRKIRSKMNINPSKQIPCFIQNINNNEQQKLEKNKKLIIKLARLKNISILEINAVAPESVIVLLNDIKILIPLEGIIDKDKEIERLKKEIEKLKIQENKLIQKLDNDKFISSAPENIVNEAKQTLIFTKKDIEKLIQQLNKINKLS